MKEHLDEKAMKQYTEMLIEQIQQMKESNWEKPWFSSNNFVTPQNINGRPYSGGNLMMLMFNQQKHGYQLPVYMTFQQAGSIGLAVNKGEKSFPICYWSRSIRDENGKKLTENEYNELSEDDKLKCKVRAFQQYFNVFNVEQTNIKAVKPDLWDTLINKLQPPMRELDDTNMLKCQELDKMLQDQSWLCSIELQPDSANAYYHKGNDAITVPEKKQFVDGESFYGTLLHEMIHSTGIEDRLNRDMSGGFGSDSYSREELVAELGSAMAAINFGINKGIKDESKEYIKGWLDNMNQDPKFLMSIISDIAKAVDMVHKNVPKIEVSADQNLSQDNAQQSVETEKTQPTLENPEVREEIDRELDDEAYGRESEAIDSGHKAHFVAAWNEGEQSNGTFYEVWLKDEDIKDENGVNKYRDLPLWNIQSVKGQFNISDTFYNREEIDAAWEEKFSNLAKDFSNLSEPAKRIAPFQVNDGPEQAVDRETKIKSDKQETVYYTSVAYFQLDTDTARFDRLKEEGDYEAILNEASEYDFSYENGIDLAHTHLSATCNPGDVILDENKQYAVVYNSSVGGTYDILRKSPEAEIWSMIQSDFLPRNASQDVRQLAERKTLEEVDNNPDISHTMTMPDGRELEWQFNRDKFTIEVGERIGDKLDVRHTIPYNFGVSLDEMIKEIHTDLSSRLEYMASTEEDVEEKNVFSNIRTIDESLRDDLIDGKKTIHEAGEDLHKAGWKNYIPDAKETLNMLHVDFDGMKHSKGDGDEALIKIDERGLMAAVNAGVDVSLRDFAIGLPPTDRRLAISIVSAALGAKSQKQLTDMLKDNGYGHDKEQVSALWEGRKAFMNKTILLNDFVQFVLNSMGTKQEKKEESKLERLQKILDNVLKGGEEDDKNVLNLLKSMTDEELSKAQELGEKRKGRSKMVKENIGSIKRFISAQIENREANRNPELAEQKAYESTIQFFERQERDHLTSFDYDSYIRHREGFVQKFENENNPGLAARDRGVLRAAIEMKEKYGQACSIDEGLLKIHTNLKNMHKDAILLLRSGDKYQTIKEDASKVAEITGVPLKTGTVHQGDKSVEVPIAEFPHSDLDTHLPKIVRSGNRVAICDGMDLPKVSKKDKQAQTGEQTENPQEKVSTRQEPEKREAPRLHFYYTGNGLSITEEGDKNYTGHISQEREVSLHKEFHPDNIQRIKNMAESGNMVIQNNPSDKGYLVLDPINKPSKIHENPVTLERYFLSVEKVDGKELATVGRTVLFDGKEAIDKLMGYTPENMAKLEARADNYLAQKTEELKKAFQSGNQVAIEQASVGYMHAEKYKLQQKFNPYEANERIKKIQSSVTHLKTKNMENTENEKKELKDGVSVFKMQNGQYGINEVKDGVRTPTKRLHEEDVKAYFEGLKGQPKEEVNRRRELLADKYLRGNNKTQLEEQIPKKELPPISPEVRTRLGNTSVFKMQDGANYGVRTQIDGEQHSAKRVRREDIAAFFEGYKGLPKEQQDERKAQLAALYFKDELEAPKQDYSQGMKR